VAPPATRIICFRTTVPRAAALMTMDAADAEGNMLCLFVFSELICELRSFVVVTKKKNEGEKMK
jgi:hypothetical protein